MAEVYYNKMPIYPIFYLLRGDYLCLAEECHDGQTLISCEINPSRGNIGIMEKKMETTILYTECIEVILA